MQAALKVRFRQQSIHLREKNIAGPTERSRRGGLPPLRKLAGKDLRFSMKMMRAAGLDSKLQPAWTVSVPDTLFLHP